MSSQKRKRQREIRVLMAETGLTYTQAARELNRRREQASRSRRSRASHHMAGLTGVSAIARIAQQSVAQSSGLAKILNEHNALADIIKTMPVYESALRMARMAARVQPGYDE
ncbi:hypothetical protein AB0F88_43975 [Streptosporangium sp. NPDC023963]|uniref:hypothetical protein n=1 Tax=Streptosporangium sp. NPDC023963 TaxID=3155608 RepID=UPI0034206D65